MKWFNIQIVANDGAGLRVDMDAISHQFESIPRLQLEWDGAFVWVGERWQLDGMLYDRDEQLRYVDLKGCCPLSSWLLLRALFVPTQIQASVIRLPEGGLYDLQTFENLTWA